MYNKIYLICLIYFLIIYSCSAIKTEQIFTDRYHTNYITNKYYFTNDFYYKEYLSYSNELDKLQYMTNKSLYYSYNSMTSKYRYVYFEYNYCYTFNTTKNLTNCNFE